MKTATKISLAEKFSLFQGHYQPKIIGELNEDFIKIVKIKGDFVWHDHKNEDELFLVIKGTLTIKFRGYDLVANPGEMILIPKGVEHCPTSEEESWAMLIEPKSVINTGDIEGEKTVKNPERL